MYALEKNAIRNLLIWFSLSGFFAIFYYQTVLGPSIDILPVWFNDILQGNAESPYNYRLIAPSVFMAINKALPLSVGHNFFIATFFCFLFSFAFLMRAIGFNHTDKTSVNSLLFASFFILLTFPMGGLQPWSYFDIGLYALAYMAVNGNWKKRYYLVVLSFALLNRETGVLLSVIPLVNAFFDQKCRLNLSSYKRELLIVAYGLLFLFLIRFYQGDAVHEITTEEVFLRNFSPETFMKNLFVYFGAFFWLFIGSRVRLSNVEKAFVVIFIVNIGLILFFGLFREIRMFVPYVFLFGLIYSRSLEGSLAEGRKKP